MVHGIRYTEFARGGGQVTLANQRIEFGDSPYADGATVVLRLSELKQGSSPRLGGVSHSHVQLLVQVEHQWPPILVSRDTYEIVDGVHRYHAARLLGRSTIRCSLFDGDADDIFIESVRRNVEHGLPLSQRERQEAVRRVLASRSAWSDRRIALHCGIAPGTVGSLRRHLANQDARSDKREGRDGRIRRTDRDELRRETEEALRARPAASLREVARVVGASPGTVARVRASLVSRAPSEPEHDRGIAVRPAALSEPVPLPKHLVALSDEQNGYWGGDLALKSMTDASSFLDWFSQTAVGTEELDWYANVPLSRVYEVADEARRRSVFWAKFAEALEGRVRTGLCPR